jgi:phage FluMu gp28-like protein
VLLDIARQLGKSTTVGDAAAYKAKFTDNALALIFSPSLRQSFELFDKARSLVADMAVEYNRHEVRLNNGSRIVSLPGSPDTVRGYSKPDFIGVDEAAFVREELFVAITPMLATNPNAELWVMSTPNGKVGYFYEQWVGPGDWLRVKVRADECPRISKEFLAEARATMSRRAYEQEYECEFRDHVEAVFLEDDIMAAFRDDVKEVVLP